METKQLQHKFHYIKDRPLIMAKLKHISTARYFEFLVDSGADYTLISKSSASLLGIALKNLKKSRVELASLEFINVYKTNITIIINKEELKIPILIADTEVECLLGRKGIFDRFKVIFNERERSITLLPN